MLFRSLAEQCRTDLDALQALAQRPWKRIAKSADGSTLRLRLPALRKQPPALQRQIVRLALQQVQGDLIGFEFRHWREIEQLITERPMGTIVDLPGGVQVVKESDAVRITRSALAARAEACVSRDAAFAPA